LLSQKRYRMIGIAAIESPDRHMPLRGSPRRYLHVWLSTGSVADFLTSSPKTGCAKPPELLCSLIGYVRLTQVVGWGSGEGLWPADQWSLRWHRLAGHAGCLDLGCAL
jgi:hypothetical protein